MAIPQKFQQALLKELQKQDRKQEERRRRRESLYSLEEVRDDLLDWLRQLRLPQGSPEESWEDRVQELPRRDDSPKAAKELAVRLALRLHTRENQYLVTILQCSESASRGVYILTCHVNWKEGELDQQQLVEQLYTGSSSEDLRPRNTLWAQTFDKNGLTEAMNAAATAIMGNELVSPEGDEAKDRPGQPMARPIPAPAPFPVREDF